MGWSVSVACKSISSKEKMLAFLEKHYRTGKETGAGFKDHHPTEYFAYGWSKAKIGFDKPDDYDLTILRWVASKVGKKRYLKKYNAESICWLNLDGSDYEPIIPHDVWDGNPETERYVLDENGFLCKIDRWWSWTDSFGVKAAAELLQLEKRTDRRELLIKEEIERLNSLWEELE